MTSDQPLPRAVTGTDLVLHAILAELRGLRGDMEAAPVAWRQRLDQIAGDVAALKGALPASRAEPVDGETIELREPGAAPKRRGR